MMSSTGRLEEPGGNVLVEPTVRDSVIERDMDPLDAVTFTE